MSCLPVMVLPLRLHQSSADFCVIPRNVLYHDARFSPFHHDRIMHDLRLKKVKLILLRPALPSHDHSVLFWLACDGFLARPGLHKQSNFIFHVIVSGSIMGGMMYRGKQHQMQHPHSYVSFADETRMHHRTMLQR